MEIEVSDKLINFIIFIPLFLISLSIHEFAHALMAKKYGDNTAEALGRLTLNPIKHIDLVGSLLLPIMSFFSGFMLIGWAKPVPINPNNFKNRLKDDAIVSAAGPVSNFLLACIVLILIIILGRMDIELSERANYILWLAIYFNIFLFLFNLLPIPPLDGSHIVYDLFPNKFTAKLQTLGMWGTLILLFFIYSPLWELFTGLIHFILGVFQTIKGAL